MASETPTSPPIDEARARLREHFEQNTDQHTKLWNDLWKAGDFLPWDRGPNPALHDTLFSKREILGSPAPNGLRKKALVPGCGRGYDCFQLASFGYDAVGLDASDAALAAAKEEQVVAEREDKYPVKDASIGKGSIVFVEGDFFDEGWVKEVGAEAGFDLIFDYTFLSALPPTLRPAWSSRMSRLLTPTGHLICLEFPTYKDPASGGPPWALPSVVYEQHLARPGEDVLYDDVGNVIVVKEAADQGNELTLVKVAHWQPERTHEIGKGTDWVSIWEHR